MSKRTKPAKRGSRKAAVREPASVNRKPGVIATIIELIGATNGASKDEMVSVLVKKFPDRNPDSMRNTIGLNMHLYAARRERIEGRGLVYYGKKK